MRHTLNNKRGFTVVELLVVAPLVLLTIGTFITVIVNMTGDVLASRASNVLIYNIQDALSRIEDDVKLSTTFLAENNVTLSSPQGFNNGATTKFENVDTTNGDALVLNMLATTGNPLVATSGLIYLQNLPNSCTSTEITQNTPMTMNVVYFVKNNTLWRRTLMQSDYATAGCSVPWQQPSCSPTLFVNGSWGSNTFCKAQDIKLVENINPSDFSVKYFSSASATDASATASDTTSCIPVTDPACVALRNTALQSLATAGVSINVSTLAAGRTISQTGSIRATRLDINASTIAPVTVATTPTSPSVSASLSTPNRVVFTWPTIPGATGYTFQYQLNGTGGSWTTAFSNQNTTTYTVTANHQDVVYGRASATNTAGTSSYSANTSVTIPLWATPLMQNTWSNYSTTYAGVGYTKTSEGVVLLHGLIKRSGSVVSGEALFYLPEDYRPDLKQIYTTITNPNAASRIDITPEGKVAVLGGNAGYLSLDGIKFVPTSTTSISFQPMTLSNGWVNFDVPTHQVASYAKDSLNRTFTRGVIKSGSTTAASLISGLSSGYLSPSYLHLPALGNSGIGFFSPAQTNTTYPGAGIQYKAGGNGYLSIEGMFYNNYTGWNSLSMANGWTWYDATGIFATPAYIKASDGIVSLKGLIRSGTATSDTTVANLPAGYRPKSRLIFFVMNNNTVGRVDVLADGQVRIMTGGNTWLALDNINFVAEQ